jgi:hypothetical protein
MSSIKPNEAGVPVGHADVVHRLPVAGVADAVDRQRAADFAQEPLANLQLSQSF